MKSFNKVTVTPTDLICLDFHYLNVICLRKRVQPVRNGHLWFRKKCLVCTGVCYVEVIL